MPRPFRILRLAFILLLFLLTLFTLTLTIRSHRYQTVITRSIEGGPIPDGHVLILNNGIAMWCAGRNPAAAGRQAEWDFHDIPFNPDLYIMEWAWRFKRHEDGWEWLGFAHHHFGGLGGVSETCWSFPLYLPALLLCAASALMAYRLLRQRRRLLRSRAGLCPTCGYDLRASPEKCPECGTPAGRIT